MRALLISCLCLAVAARPKMRPADDREEATVGGGAEDTDEDMVHNWETKDPVLRGWANMQVCLDNIRYSQATLTEGTSVAGSFADKLAGRVKGLLDLRVVEDVELRAAQLGRAQARGGGVKLDRRRAVQRSSDVGEPGVVHKDSARVEHVAVHGQVGKHQHRGAAVRQAHVPLHVHHGVTGEREPRRRVRGRRRWRLRRRRGRRKGMNWRRRRRPRLEGDHGALPTLGRLVSELLDDGSRTLVVTVIGVPPVEAI